MGLAELAPAPQTSQPSARTRHAKATSRGWPLPFPLTFPAPLLDGRRASTPPQGVARCGSIEGVTFENDAGPGGFDG